MGQQEWLMQGPRVSKSEKFLCRWHLEGWKGWESPGRGLPSEERDSASFAHLTSFPSVPPGSLQGSHWSNSTGSQRREPYWWGEYSSVCSAESRADRGRVCFWRGTQMTPTTLYSDASLGDHPRGNEWMNETSTEDHLSARPMLGLPGCASCSPKASPLPVTLY